ncbi:DUF2256 domain-containing protein [Skeletonema marinoi]|uniref:DUF2256 domain-containing protein n=1 Tax=Skeletonema marinoi TaxID=267567 RepID=A0AAD8XXG3_9STRA|nr:DUF2256 domain-containing protein [Skeletonema marinoi]
MVIQQLVRVSIYSSAFIHQGRPGPYTYTQHRYSIQRRCTSNSFINNEIDLEAMPRGVKKENLPVKTCTVCNRPFTWRKKWEKVWDEVTTCSTSCNRKRKETNRQLNKTIHDSSNVEDPFVAIRENINIGCTESSIDDKEQLLNNMDSVLESDFDGEDQLLDSICGDMLAMEIGAQDDSSISESDAITDAKAKRKAEKKRKKAERRAQREGRGDPTAGQKQCTLCAKSVNLLIRCQHDKSGEWAMVCGKCWNDVSGGVVDGDDSHPYYRYGGLWKNRRAQT